MALLSEDKRKEYFATLGLGEYNKENIQALQKKYMARKRDVDGVYGQNTDNLLRTLYNVKKYTKNFKAEEFKCECNGKHCCGYPTYMKPVELMHIQTIRDHYGKPITVTCGMRCSGYNKELNGSIQNSLHLSGNAIDFYQKGVTDTLANRKASIKYIKTLPNHHYTYGNGINSYGASVSASYMGNALHTDTQGSLAPSDGKLNVDGKGGAATVKAMQRFFSTTQDGVISGQKKSLGKYYPALTAVQYGSGGSATVKKLQKWLGVKQDGIIGQQTVKAWQKKLGIKADGIFGTASMKSWQKYLNSNDKAVYPTIAPTDTATNTSSASTKPALTIETASANALKIVAKAKEYCWPYGTASKTYSYDKGKPLSAYKTALKKYLKKTAKVSQSDCGYFVSTCVRAAGVSSSFLALKGVKDSFPSVPSNMQIVLKGKKIPDGFLKPGDIIRYKKTSSQHTLMYFGDGKIAEAGRKHWFPAIKKDTKKYNKSNVKISTLQVIRAK